MKWALAGASQAPRPTLARPNLPLGWFLDALEQLLLLAKGKLVPLQKQLREKFILGVEEGGRDPKDFGQLLGGLELGFVFPPFVLVDSRRSHGGIQAGKNAELLLG